MLFVGIDQANRHTGLAIGESEGGAKPSISALLSLNLPGGEQGEAGSRIVVSAVRERVSTAGALVRLERPPNTVRADVAHGPQAQIGWTLGYLAGRVGAFLESDGHSVALVGVRSWRASMLRLTERWGYPVSLAERAQRKPSGERQGRKVSRNGDDLEVVWADCGHTTLVGAFASLRNFAHQVCPACVALREQPRPSTEAEDRTERWKMLACELTAHHFPTAYAPLVAEARKRARKQDKPDHKLSGVSDACEAVWIGCSVLDK